MKQKKGSLASTEIESNSEYKSKNETSTSFTLPLYTLLLPIQLPPSSLLSPLSLSPYNIRSKSSRVHVQYRSKLRSGKATSVQWDNRKSYSM